MDKKNTILLTIIAVATLLVAVVGATFAYYSVATANSTTKINVNATSGPVGAITLYNPNTELGMTITPTDMAQLEQDKHFYALIYSNGNPSNSTQNEADPAVTNGKYATTKKNHVMTRALLVGGDENTAYTCTSKLKVTLNTAEGSIGRVLQEGDAILYFTTKQTTMRKTGEEAYMDKQTLDLHDLVKVDQSSGELVYDVIYKVNGNTIGGKNEANIYADLEITNKSNKNQNYLVEVGQDAGATLTLYLEVPEFNCTIDTQ